MLASVFFLKLLGRMFTVFFVLFIIFVINDKENKHETLETTKIKATVSFVFTLVIFIAYYSFL